MKLEIAASFCFFTLAMCASSESMEELGKEMALIKVSKVVDGAIDSIVDQFQENPVSTAAAFEEVSDLKLPNKIIKRAKKSKKGRGQVKGRKMGIHTAVGNQDLEALRVLLSDRNAKVNDFNEEEETPLMLAVRMNYYEIVTALLEHGNILVNLADKSGRTALHMAVFYSRLDIAYRLMAVHGIDLNATDKSGMTALNYAVSDNKINFVTALANDPSIEINKVDLNGRSVLHIAAKLGHEEIIEALIAAGANASLHDKYERTPLYYATKKGYTESISALKRDPNDVSLGYILK